MEVEKDIHSPQSPKKKKKKYKYIHIQLDRDRYLPSQYLLIEHFLAMLLLDRYWYAYKWQQQ